MEKITLRDIKAQGPGSILEEIARRGAQQMLAQAMEPRWRCFIENHADKVDEDGAGRWCGTGTCQGAS